MRWPAKLSLRHKITLVIMVNTLAALCVASIAFAEYGVYLFKKLQMQDLNALANVMGTNSTAALAFKDQNSARDVLQALAAKPHILAASIFDRDGKPFAMYAKGAQKDAYFPPAIENETSRFTSDRVLIFQKITLDGEKVGNIFLEGDTVEYQQLLEGYLLFFGLILVAVSLGAYAVAEQLQRPISNPILDLAWTTKMVTGSRDYSIRARKQSEDEVGVLIDGFNEMLAQIQKRDGDLNSARDDLERRVDERTLELEQEMADRQRAQEALSESEGRIRLLLDSTAEAIFGMDRDGKCTFSNPATLRLLGYRMPEDLLEKDMHLMMHHSHNDGTPYRREDCGIANSLAKGEGMHSDQEVFWRADGTRFPVEYWAYPIRRDGEAVGAVVTFLDITERKQAQKALLEAKDAAEAGSRAKSEFLANMSHEIRTPMNGIIGMTDLALDTDLFPEQREYLGLVKSSAESLLHVINDILDFSKIEAGKLELEKTEFEIRDLLRDTLKTLAVRADKKHLELAVRVSPQVPERVVGDPTRLRQLIVNLVGNAIKFTEDGNVIVDANLESKTADRIDMHISVSDTGIGIPFEKQRIIFESFAQVDGSTTRRFGGTGLGLTISRQLVELMGGRMWVESEVGKGSTFHFTTAYGYRAAPPSDRERVAVQALPGLDVLVADDNAPNRNILGEMMINWRMNPILVEDGVAALVAMESACAAGRPFPIVLLDARMPGMDGFRVLERIREQPALAGSVILLLAADRDPMDVTRCRELGVQMVLTKPIGQSELLDSILSVLGVGVVEKRLIETAAPLPEKARGAALNILLAEDNPVNQTLAVRLLEKAGHHIVLAGTGKEALEKCRTCSGPGFDVILMDIQMPEMDGMQATTAIRELEIKTGKHIPIIAMTAHAMRGDKERCLAGGMDGYISKPINPNGLFAEIERCLPRREQETAMTIHSHESGPESFEKRFASMADRLDLAALLERVEGDHELLAELIHLFVDDAPRQLSAMHDALLRGDMSVLERAAHSMKGAASNLSAQATVAAALGLEKTARNGDTESSKANLLTLELSLNQLLSILAEFNQEVSK
jgi:two-component system, sensor histidine kinase and response regulator